MALVAAIMALAAGGPAAAQEAGLHQLPAESCAGCHPRIFEQWAGSLHARSTPLADPIHDVFYRALAGDPLQEDVRAPDGTFPDCLQCHAPIAALDGKTRLDAQFAYAQGVTCTACHLIEAYHGEPAEPGQPAKLGIDAYTYSRIRMQGPNGPSDLGEAVPPGSANGVPTLNPFPHAANRAVFKTADVCLGCHERRDNAFGVPLCQTGAEVREGGNGATCQSCHMPTTAGFTDHTMGGGHDQGMLERSVALTVAGTKAGDNTRVTVTLDNSIAHKFPTGAPFRYAYVAVTAFDAAGVEIWRNYRENLFTDDPGAVLMLKLVGEDGKPAAPPDARKIAADTRLKPNESRTLTYAVPGKVAVVRAEVRYHLLLPPFVQKFGDKLPPYAKEPRVIAKAEARP